MSKLVLLLALMFSVVGCGNAPTTPCDDSDPVGACRFSHSRTYG